MPNQYDRILKENMGAILISLSQQYLGFKIVNSQDLPGKLQKTLEREPDFIKVVQTAGGEEFILHVEFQLTDDRHMLDRMRTYHALLAEKFKMSIRQFVIYLGRKRPTMRTTFDPEEVMSGFNMLDLQSISADRFIASIVPEEIILAILADFGNRSPMAIVRLIIGRLSQIDLSEAHLRKTIKQLGILSRIPKLNDYVKQALESMPFTIDITQDSWYIEGLEKGMAQGIEKGLEKGLEKGIEKGKKKNSEEVAIRMLRSGLLSDNSICDFTGLSFERLQELKKSL